MKKEKKLVRFGLCPFIITFFYCITALSVLWFETTRGLSLFYWIIPFTSFLIVLSIFILFIVWYSKIKSKKKGLYNFKLNKSLVVLNAPMLSVLSSPIILKIDDTPTPKKLNFLNPSHTAACELLSNRITKRSYKRFC